MKNTPAEILQGYLTAQSGATFTQPSGSLWPLFVSAMPDQPDDAGSIYDTTGVIYSRLLASGFVIESYGIQLKVRSLIYRDAYRLASETADTLSKVSRTIVNLGGNMYTIDTVRKTSPVLSMGQDEKRRALCSVNFLLMLIGQ